MIDDTTKSVKAMLYDRVTSPLSGMLIIAWLAFNWKPLVFILWGKTPILDRITFVKETYVGWWPNAIGPLLTALLLVFLYPLISYFPFMWWTKFEQLKRKIKQDMSKHVLLTFEQSQHMREELRVFREESEKSHQEKDARIIFLEGQIADLSEAELPNESYLTEPETIERSVPFGESEFIEAWDNLNEVQQSIVNHLYKREPDPIRNRKFAEYFSGVDFGKIVVYLTKLSQVGIVSRHNPDDATGYNKLTDFGREMKFFIDSKQQ